MIIGTAGHIDHGKTSLVKALTGVDTDRLQEEKARGITIDLGFAYKPSASGTPLGFVDVPGHEKLVRNMLAGATGIDHVLLVVAADDGPMPQTREHLAILDLLGLTQGVVALTKADLVSHARLAEAQREVVALLAPTGLAGAPVVPVSSLTGLGIDTLQMHLNRASSAVASRRADGHFRLAVDRSFSLPGIGTVVTGTAVAGRVAVGDKLLVSPRGQAVRVRGLHAQNREAHEGVAGQRLALNLAGVEKSDIARGDWIVADAAHAPTQRIDAKLRVLASENKPLAHWTPVHVHLGAANVGARVVLLESAHGEPLAAGGSAWVQLELDRPIGALHGDRFILRDPSALRTLGGGHVVDAFAPLARRRKRERPAVLQALDQPHAEQALAALLALQQPEGVDLQRFRTLWNLPATATLNVPHRVVTAELARGKAHLAFATQQLDVFVKRMVDVLSTHHRRAPDSPGLTSEHLLRALSAQAKPSAAVFAALLKELGPGASLQRHGPYWRLASHEASLQGADLKLWERLLPWLIEGGFTKPPKLTDMLARDRALHREQVTRLLTKAGKLGKLYVVGAEYFILTAHMQQLAAQAQALACADSHHRLNVKLYRETTGMSRHLSIPLVEFFDHIGFTQRDAEGRKIRRSAEDLFGGS